MFETAWSRRSRTPQADRLGLDAQGERNVGMQIDETVHDFLDQVARIEVFELQFEFTRANSANIQQAVDQRDYPVELKLKFFQDSANVAAGPLGNPIQKLTGEMNTLSGLRSSCPATATTGTKSKISFPVYQESVFLYGAHGLSSLRKRRAPKSTREWSR